MMPISSAEYALMLARTNKMKAATSTGEPVKKESDLHEQIFAECRRRGWIAFHGAMSERTSRTLGEPDFQVYADRGRVFLIECKSKAGKLSIAQAAIKIFMEKLGHTVHVVRSFQDFLEVVK